MPKYKIEPWVYPGSYIPHYLPRSDAAAQARGAAACGSLADARIDWIEVACDALDYYFRLLERLSR